MISRQMFPRNMSSGGVFPQHFFGLACSSCPASPGETHLQATLLPIKKAAASDNSVSATVVVPEKMIGRVVGPKGANIMLIKEKTGQCFFGGETLQAED